MTSAGGRRPEEAVVVVGQGYAYRIRDLEEVYVSLEALAKICRLAGSGEGEVRVRAWVAPNYRRAQPWRLEAEGVRQVVKATDALTHGRQRHVNLELPRHPLLEELVGETRARESVRFRGEAIAAVARLAAGRDNVCLLCAVEEGNSPEVAFVVSHARQILRVR